MPDNLDRAPLTPGIRAIDVMFGVEVNVHLHGTFGCKYLRAIRESHTLTLQSLGPFTYNNDY